MCDYFGVTRLYSVEEEADDEAELESARATPEEAEIEEASR